MPFRPFSVAALVGALVAAPAVGTVTAGPAQAAGPTLPAPAWSNGGLGDVHLSSPTVADVNGDGVKDVVVGDLNGNLHVLDGATGRDLPGWPAHAPGAIESSAAVAVLNPGEAPTIVVGYGSIDVRGSLGGVIAFNANGSVRWNRPGIDQFNEWTGGGPDGIPEATEGSPAIGDIIGDGRKEVVWGSFDHRIYAVDSNGNDVPGFPIDNRDTIWDSPALYDVSHSGHMDIFIGGDSSGGWVCPPGGMLQDIRYQGGPHVVWSVCEPEIFQSSPAIGDLEGNGRMSLVIGTGTFYMSRNGGASNRVYAFHLDDGSPVPGWPQGTNGPTFGSPVIGDVTGGGRNDVVITTCAGCPTSNPGRVYAWTGNGGPLWNVNPGAQEGATSEMISTPILVDLNGDGVNDVAVGSGAGFYLIRGQDGSRLYQPLVPGRAIQNSAAAADMGGSVGWRLIVVSRVPGQAALALSVPLPGPPRASAWPQWRFSADHLGSPTPACPPHAAPTTPTGVVSRAAGQNRDETAVTISQASFPSPSTAHAVVLASDGGYPDALAGTPLAVAKQAPLLLTPSAGLPPGVAAEITRVAPSGSTVYILGGDAALSSGIEAQVLALGDVPQRISGSDRFGTAVAIAGVLGNPKVVLEATGFNFPDALSAGAAAAKQGGAVLLTDGSSAAPATAGYLATHGGDSRFAIGGPAAAADPGATAIVGADRWDTSVKVAEQFYAGAAPTFGFASGVAFPDALSGGANVGAKGGPLLLVPDCGSLPAITSGYLAAARAVIRAGMLYGGTGAVGDDVLSQLEAQA